MVVKPLVLTENALRQLQDQKQSELDPMEEQNLHFALRKLVLMKHETLHGIQMIEQAFSPGTSLSAQLTQSYYLHSAYALETLALRECRLRDSVDQPINAFTPDWHRHVYQERSDRNVPSERWKPGDFFESYLTSAHGGVLCLSASMTAQAVP